MRPILAPVLTLLLLLGSHFSNAQPQIQLIDFASGFTRPVAIAHAADSRLFVAEQRGLIWIVDSLGNKSAEPFLDIDAAVRSTANEQGLLGLAFHPQYAQNGFFYVYYTREPDGDSRVSRFTRDPQDPGKADPGSELILFTIDQPFSNHNAGCLKFGPDGYLYIAVGDGGSAGDPQNNGQKKNTLLGKILRIDIDAPTGPYAVPADNPFVNDPAYLPEIWSLGWRNPWRFSFDRLTGDMWIGDVGQNKWEEIDFEPAGIGGRNYGWRCYEGLHPYNTTNCAQASDYEAPAFEYANPSLGCSVTGGYVYRGSQYGDLYGYYIFTDYCSGRWWVSRQLPDGSFSTQLIADLSNNQYSTLGEDHQGALYVANLAAGKIQRITEICSGFQLEADVTPALCLGSLDGSIDLSITGGTGTIDFNWSANTNGQTDSLVVYLDPGTYSVTATNGNGCVREASFEVPAADPVAPPTLSYAPGDTLPWCPGDTIYLQATTAPAGYQIEWYRDGVPLAGTQDSILPITTPGQYSAAYLGTICRSLPAGPVTIFSAAAAEPQVSLPGGIPVLCPDGSLLLESSPAPAGYSYQWLVDGEPLPGATAQTYTVEFQGAYSVQHSGICGDYLSESVLIYQETFFPLSIGAIEDTLIAPPSWDSYQWFLDGQPIAGADNDTLIAEVSGYYTCVVTSPNGCTYTDGIQLEISSARLPEAVLSFSLAPNPGDGRFLLRMEFQRPEKIEISLHDGSQRRWFHQTLQGQSVEKQIDLQALPAGTYYLTVRLESGSFVRPVVKL